MYTRLRLVGDFSRELVSDTSIPGEPYSGRKQYETQLVVTGLCIDPEPVSDAAARYPHDTDAVIVDFPVRVGDSLWLVLVRYTDGGTFNQDIGLHYLCGALKTAIEASARCRAIREDSFVPYGDQGYLPWKGYFARLESVEAMEVRILERP